VDKLRRARKVAFVAIAALAMVLAVNAPSQARGGGGHGFGGGHPGGAFGRHGFDGHRGFDGHHGFNRFGHSRFLFGFGGPVYPYYGYYGYYPPAYGYEAPAYWYYCPTYRAYYPNVGSCPETWIPVPAS
jgi:hypothetical protein